ncbi:MAG: DUF4190 domain-containing protein [Chloroflexi bacterium]|nr:DUF4190 domain-containing protein [Chloroflexota bacterium]
MALLPKNRLATTSLTLGLVGWAFYFLQWCFDLTLGVLLAALTVGTSAFCSTILDTVPFVFWLAGIVTGYAALGQIKRSGGSGRGRAVWGLVLNYFGLFFIVIFTVIAVILVATGVGVGVLDKVFPLLQK